MTLKSLVELGSGVYASTQADTSSIFCDVGLNLYVACSASEVQKLCFSRKSVLQRKVASLSQQIMQLQLLEQVSDA